jgi:hypothetical protein
LNESFNSFIELVGSTHIFFDLPKLSSVGLLPPHILGVVVAACTGIFQCARKLTRHDLVVENRSQIFAFGFERCLRALFVNEFFVFTLKLLVCTQWQYLFCDCVLWDG